MQTLAFAARADAGSFAAATSNAPCPPVRRLSGESNASDLCPASGTSFTISRRRCARLWKRNFRCDFV